MADDDDRPVHPGRIENLEDLDWACKLNRAVIVPGSRTWGRRPNPAAFMMQQHGDVLLGLFRMGMYVYEKKK